jgi:hypothetical protein
VGIQATPFENDWDIWIYPAQIPVETPPEVWVTSDLDERALGALENGGRVLLTVPPARIKPDPRKPVALGFSSIFWNTAWTKGQPPHTLGILCDPRHPALAQFPTEYHSNWQWWYLISRAGAIVLDELPRNLEPTVRIIDDWFTNRRLALLFEARVGKGRLVMCGLDLQDPAAQDPVTRQFRHSLLTYMTSPRFKPAAELTPAQVRSLLVDPRP